MHPYRTHTCGELRQEHAGQTVRLSGWIHNRRDLGGVLFIDLRDHYGISQVVVPPEAAFQDAIGRLGKETVIKIDGAVRIRPEGTANPNLATGAVEVVVASYEVLGNCQPLPMNIFPEDHTPEDTRLTYRFLDLRRSQLHQNIVQRSRVIASIRRRMTDLGFNEFQTPILTASSPEGARDFLVPSRLHPGKFYALPQAPQQFKQLLMISGFDRYFQIAPCFRDEDARADRSPGEFYQLDMEMSFATQDDVFGVCEKLFPPLFQEFSNWAVPLEEGGKFPRITYAEAMLKYGVDKPDLRIPLEIVDATDLFVNHTFKAFANKVVRVLKVPGCSDKPRSWFDGLQDFAKKLGAQGLAYIKFEGEEGTPGGPIARHIPAENLAELKSRTSAGTGDTLFFSANPDASLAAGLLGHARNHFGRELNLIEPNTFRFCWIVDFPMFEKDPETGAVAFSHNPFSMPQGGMDALLNQDPLTIKAYQYDIVCNGIELSSGAIRNHVPEIMYKAFELAGYGPEVVNDRFKGMISALKFGAPPHGGIAPGVDRIVMLLANEPNLREIIAFPMNQNAQDLMMNAPSPISDKQLRDVHLSIRKPPVTPGAAPAVTAPAKA
ncbi:MAG TPA: aspartate--tRNA ligase [Candidatus Methylacidiphilales bacterium]|nr:aspartate--tRNA ligase [Candidatus Methylacidiphilales bacterium]